MVTIHIAGGLESMRCPTFLTLLALLWDIRHEDDMLVSCCELAKRLGWVKASNGSDERSDIVVVVFGVGAEQRKVLYTRVASNDS